MVSGVYQGFDYHERISLSAKRGLAGVFPFPFKETWRWGGLTLTLCHMDLSTVIGWGSVYQPLPVRVLPSEDNPGRRVGALERKKEKKEKKRKNGPASGGISYQCLETNTTCSPC